MKTCIFCAHWHFDSGTPDYSELTPGEDWEMKCMKGKWSCSGSTVSPEEFRDHIKKADNCEEFEEVK